MKRGKPAEVLKVVELLSQGLTISAACRQVGIHQNTYYYWKNRFPELAVNRSGIIVGILIGIFEKHPELTTQQACDRCDIGLTTFRTNLRKSEELRVAYRDFLARHGRGKFTSFYAQQLAKKGYSRESIKEILARQKQAMIYTGREMITDV